MSDKNKTNDKLIEAYNLMMLHVSEALSKATTAAEPRVRKAIESAEQKAEELGELSREEIDKVSEYLRRDIQDAADYLAGPESQEFQSWLKFDIELIEQRLLDMALKCADQAKLDMLEFEEQLLEASQYKTGEITGAGTLVCTDCGEVLHFHQTGHIPPCPKCRGTSFERSSEEA